MRLLLLFLVCLSWLNRGKELLGQAGSASQPAPSITTTVSLVVTDVTVTDKAGNPVPGLGVTDFVVQDAGEQQRLKNVDEHSVATPPIPVDLKLGPDMFSDYVPVSADGPLDVLLIDSLNTPEASQAYLRSQLKDYFRHAEPHASVAVFGLSQRLTMLQGFTTDTAILREFVNHHDTPRAQALSAGTGSLASQSLLDANFGSAKEREVISQLRQFEAESAAAITGSRVRLTLDAFNVLARYLGSMPGRKNLIWFSGSFPVMLFPDPTIAKPSEGALNVSGDLEATARLMSRARIAVYPVDVRGLQTSSVYDATEAHGSYARKPDGFDLKQPDRWTMNPTDNATGDAIRAQNTATQEHAAMEQVAAVTGGQAFFNTNGISEALKKALRSGDHYYTLSWLPAKQESAAQTFRKVHIELTGDNRKRGYHLSYREGYVPNDSPLAGLKASIGPSTHSSGEHSNRLSDLLMTHGAPAPSDLLFKVQVTQPDPGTSKDLQKEDHANPNHPMRGPYRQLLVELVALAPDLHLQLGSDGKYSGHSSLILCVYTSNGSLLNSQRVQFGIAISATDYRRLLAEGFRARSIISIPNHEEVSLRIGLRDDLTDRIGVVELSSSQVVPLPNLQRSKPTTGSTLH